MNTSHLFCYAAKGLQSYIMRGGKLRDMVGATSLIDKLSDRDHLKGWLDGLFGVAGKYEVLQAAAGGARIKFTDKDAADEVARFWPLWCHAWAPDLDVVQDLQTWGPDTSYGKVSKAAGEQLERNRNFPAARMPEAGPFVKRGPRTGEPAVSPKVTFDGNPHYDLTGDDGFIDQASKRKRQERLKLVNKLPPVAEAFGFTDANRLPEDFTQISGPDKAYLAVVHADGNRLGQMFLDVGRALDACGPEHDDAAIALFKYLSQDVVAEGARKAVRAAIDSLSSKARPDDKPWLFAPIVLAGDDVTVVCRADLGLPFAEKFLTSFRAEMKSRLVNIEQQDWWKNVPEDVRPKVPRDLSAGAGVVFCTDHYPFSLAYELCESLAKHVKNTAKAKAGESGTPPSALSFVRITGASAPTEFDDLAEGILKGSDGTLLTGGPYFVDAAGDGTEVPQPPFADLWKLFDAACPLVKPGDPNSKRRLALPGSGLRGLLNLQRTDIARVPEAVERMAEVACERGGKSKEAWKQFEEAWRTLCGPNQTFATPSQLAQPASDAPHKTSQSGHQPESPQRDWKDLTFFDARTRDGKRISPFYDLLTLIAVRDKARGDEKDAPPAAGATGEQP